MQPDEDDPQALRLAYVDWRLKRLASDLQNIGDSDASRVTAQIDQARQHLPQDVADGSVPRLTEARETLHAEAGGHLAVVQLCRTVLGNCQAILHDYLDIRDADFPLGEDDYASPCEFPAWDRFRDAVLAAGG